MGDKLVQLQLVVHVLFHQCRHILHTLPTFRRGEWNWVLMNQNMADIMRTPEEATFSVFSCNLKSNWKGLPSFGYSYDVSYHTFLIFSAYQVLFIYFFKACHIFYFIYWFPVSRWRVQSVWWHVDITAKAASSQWRRKSLYYLIVKDFQNSSSNHPLTGVATTILMTNSLFKSINLTKLQNLPCFLLFFWFIKL